MRSLLLFEKDMVEAKIITEKNHKGKKKKNQWNFIFMEKLRSGEESRSMKGSSSGSMTFSTQHQRFEFVIIDPSRSIFVDLINHFVDIRLRDFVVQLHQNFLYDRSIDFAFIISI